jgi:ubiquinone/menaquinone biosynthesis C-methylase UbiE
MSDIPNRETFESMYSEKAPWDIGRPQKVFVEIADQVQGSVLDAGCGTGENALFFAERGHPVLGIDFLDFPIREAKRKARERGSNAEFICMDALKLTTFDRQFDSVIDSGLFHCFSDADRAVYVEGLTHVTKSGGKLFLACFSDEEPGTFGPRRISEEDLYRAFAKGWNLEFLRRVQFETIPETKDAFSPGGPKSWFLGMNRSG